MPISFTLTLIGSFSMAGLPPFNGFLSKEMFFTGILNASKLNVFNMDTFGMLFPVIAWVASVFTFIYCMILVFKTFTGKHQPEKLEKSAHEASNWDADSTNHFSSTCHSYFLFPKCVS